MNNISIKKENIKPIKIENYNFIEDKINIVNKEQPPIMKIKIEPSVNNNVQVTASSSRSKSRDRVRFNELN